MLAPLARPGVGGATLCKANRPGKKRVLCRQRKQSRRGICQLRGLTRQRSAWIDTGRRAAHGQHQTGIDVEAGHKRYLPRAYVRGPNLASVALAYRRAAQGPQRESTVLIVDEATALLYVSGHAAMKTRAARFSDVNRAAWEGQAWPGLSRAPFAISRGKPIS